MIKKGASGYLNKQCDPGEIVAAIKVVARGRRYLGAEVSSLLLDDIDKPGEDEPHKKLTEREFQIFLRLAQGQSSEEAARDLSLTPNTVSTYRVKIMRKVQARTNSELTYYAIKHNLIA